MIILDRVAQGAVGTGAAQVTIGSFTAAEWSDKIMGIKPAANLLGLTADTGLDWTWQLSSNEVKGMQPIDGPGSWSGSPDATNAQITQSHSEFFPLNVPIFGGESVDFLVTMEAAAAANGTAYCTLWYGNAGDALPASYDPLPGRQRYYLSGTITAAAAGAATATGTAYNVVGGSALTEVYGNISKDAVAAADPMQGTFRLESSGFDASPVRYGGEHGIPPALGTLLGTNAANMTRHALYMPIDRYTVIQDYFEGFTNMVNTDDWQTGVQFIRPGEDAGV